MKKATLEATDENILQSIKEQKGTERNTEIMEFIKALDLIEENIFISLDARWGEGKTFYVRQIEKTLEYQTLKNFETDDNKNKYEEMKPYFEKTVLEDIELGNSYLPVYYNAWLYDNHSDPLMSLLYVIIKKCGLWIDSKLVKDKTDKLKDIIKSIQVNLGIFSINGDKVIDAVSEKNIFDGIQLAEDIRQRVKEIFNQVIEGQTQKLVIFIDELDRCKPSYALEMLERIKHYFDDNRIIFIVSVNKEQLTHTISNYYGNGFDSTGYLNKFFDVNAYLPEVERRQLRFVSEYSERSIFGRMASSKNKKVSDRGVMRSFVTDAFNMASDNGRYAITARQIWYKMREISGIEEKKNTYADFTQNILTEWIDENPEYEDKINFSDRGNFYVDGSQNGLGTANVRSFINSIGTAQNIFRCYGGISSNIHIEPDFDLRYKYDKVLYIEKTGFEAIFKAEKVEEKYNMIIVSGQGFSTRAAKTLLYQFQEMGMKLYCLHDLDISGIYILDSFATPNKKFKNIIYMENLGVTIEDIRKYNIEPEKVEIKKEDRSKLENLSYEYQQFFNAGTHYRRVELNAFTTAQILEIIDEKLSRVQNLPTVNLETSLNIDHKAIKETAFMRIMSDKYTDELSKINVPIDLSQYKGRYTLETAKKEIPEIEEDLILLYEQEIEKKLNIS